MAAMPPHATARGLMEELSRRIGTEVALFDRGRPVPPEERLDCQVGVPLEVALRLKGGKGGFGSMLRAMGSQRSGFETDNIESCRDLSGRRLRHVNDERKCVRRRMRGARPCPPPPRPHPPAHRGPGPLRALTAACRIAEWAAKEEERKELAAQAKRDKRHAILNTVVKCGRRHPLAAGAPAGR